MDFNHNGLFFFASRLCTCMEKGFLRLVKQSKPSNELITHSRVHERKRNGFFGSQLSNPAIGAPPT